MNFAENRAGWRGQIGERNWDWSSGLPERYPNQAGAPEKVFPFMFVAALAAFNEARVFVALELDPLEVDPLSAPVLEGASCCSN